MRLVFSVLLVLLALLGGAEADPCRTIGGPFVTGGASVRSAQAASHFRFVQEQSGVTSAMYFCAYDFSPRGPHVQPWHVAKNDIRYGVMLPRVVLETFAAEELRGLIGHEIGHIKVFQDPRMLTVLRAVGNQRSLYVEATADAHGASWVGSQAMIRSLLAVEAYAQEHLSFFFDSGSTREITQRIQSLWEFQRIHKK